jgi:hypothetical protein
MPRSTKTLSIKYFRHPPGDHSTYGASIDRQLDDLLKTDQARQSLKKKARATLPGTAIVVERHEDGPSFFGIPLGELVNYAASLATIASTWWQLRDRRKAEPSHEVHMKVGSREYRGPIASKKDFNRIVRFLKG